MKQLFLFSILTFLIISNLSAQPTKPPTVNFVQLPESFIGEWNDECVLEVEKNIIIKKVGGALKATLKLGNVQVKSFTKIEGVAKKPDGAFEFTIATPNNYYVLDVKLDNPKVMLIKSKNTPKYIPLFSCKTINDQDEFDQLQIKYNNN